MVRTSQEIVVSVLADGSKTESIRETTLYDDGHVSTQTYPRKGTRSAEFSAKAQRGSPNEQSVSERQAVTRAAHFSVEEERLRDKLDALTKLRDSTEAKRDESNKQMDQLDDPKREQELQELQMECQRHATTQFDENNKATDLGLEAKGLRCEASDCEAKVSVLQAKLNGDPYDDSVDVGGEATEEKLQELESMAKDLDKQAKDLEDQAEASQDAKQRAADDWSSIQSKISILETDEAGRTTLQQKISIQTANLKELETAHAALEFKANQARDDALVAKDEAMELLRAREKRIESQRNLELNEAAALEAKSEAEQQRADARKEQDHKEQEQVESAQDRREAMAEREAAAAQKEAEEKQAMDAEAAEYQDWLEQAHKEKLWEWDRETAPQEPPQRSWEQEAEVQQPTKKNTPKKKENKPMGPKTDIGVWLRSMRMAQYEEQFRATQFNTLDDLIRAAGWITEADLKEIGVVLAHRKSIVQCIRAVSAIINDQQPAAQEEPALEKTVKKKAARLESSLSVKQTEVLTELFKAYAPTGELSEMGFGALCVEAMARSMLTKEALPVTAPHVRRWVRNGELGATSNIVLARLFELIDVRHCGAVSIAEASVGIACIWEGSSSGWGYCKHITGDPLNQEETCAFLHALSTFLFDVYANLAVLESCHLENVGVSGERSQQRLADLKKDLNTSESTVSAQAAVVCRILGRGRIGELPAPYRRLDELLKGLLAHDMTIDHLAVNAPATPRGPNATEMSALVRPVGKTTPRGGKKPQASENRFNDTVNEMLESRLKEIETERTQRKGARERVPSPRRLTPLTVTVRRNTGAMTARSIECSGLTTQHLVTDINKKIGFKFTKLYSLQGVPVEPSSIARHMELVASAGDAFVPIQQPVSPPKSLLPPKDLRAASPAKPRLRDPSPVKPRPGAASPARLRLNSKPLQETKKPTKARKAPLPPECRAPTTPRNTEPAGTAGGAPAMPAPSPLSTQVPRSSIRWASAARLNIGEWSDSRNIRRGAVANPY